MSSPEISLPEDRDGFRFRGGHVALDLAATLAARFAGGRELLATPSDLDRWLVSSGFAARAPHASAEDLAHSRDLREAIYAIASGGQGQGPARQALNKLAALPPARPMLTVSGELAIEGSATELLSTIAREAIALLGGPERDRIRQCDGEGCAILFLDLSRSGGRRWCSMSGCGNRAKARSFRKRKHAG
jgi:predicted RNA-binding Zn ribbon-like protein